MDLKHLNMKALLDHILEKKQKLSTDVVIKIMDPTTTTYDMVGVLCDYINAFKLVENKADLAAFCDLSKTLEDVKNKNKLLSNKYNQCIKQTVTTSQKVSKPSTDCREYKLYCVPKFLHCLVLL